MEIKENIFGKTLPDIVEIVASLGLPAYSSGQITNWLYKKNANACSEMTNLSLDSRKKLDEKYYVGKTGPISTQKSTDGTVKYLFPVSGGKYIESVLIPEDERNTLCVSTQAGCKLGCVFCMTGKQGFHGNLSSGEILNQIVSLPGSPALSNIVLMGMGEPMDNIDNVLMSLEIITSDYGYAMSPSRITVSTTGLLPGLEKFMVSSNCHLAISLNSPFEAERRSLMPVEKAYPIQKVVEFVRNQKIARQRRISFEYIMFRGINDTPAHIKGLTRLLNGLRCRINLIRYHPIPESNLKPSDENTIQWFKNKLNEKGILTTIRASRGYDIQAACGMLATDKNLT